MRLFKLFLTLGLTCYISSATAAEKPNILFILVDDLGWRDLSSYGSELYETPNIDLLAQGGLRFNQAYTAASICSPTRISILTGQYPARLNVTDWLKGWNYPHEKKRIPKWNWDGLTQADVTIGELLQKQGYRTAWLGKWHAGGHPPEVNLNAKPLKHTTAQHHGFHAGETNYQTNGKLNPEDPKGIQMLTQQAIAFIEDAEHSDRPWFVTLSHYAVHTPVHSRKVDMKRYKRKLMMQGKRAQTNAGYAAMVSALDDSVGHLMRFMNKNQRLKNTLVLFYSDNGGLDKHDSNQPTNNAPLRNGKSSLYEGGIRVPFIAYWPGKIQPGRSDFMMNSIDLMPTLADVAKTSTQGLTIDGQSLLPLLLEQKELQRETLYWHYPHYHRQSRPVSAIRDGRFKLIQFLDSEKVELYDLGTDLSEKHNLASQHPQLVSQLLAKLALWKLEVKAQPMRSNPEYDPNKAAYN